MWKQRGIFDMQKYTDKSMWKRPRFFNQQNYFEKNG